MHSLPSSLSYCLYEEKIQLIILLLLLFGEDDSRKEGREDFIFRTISQEYEETFCELYDPRDRATSKSAGQMLKDQRRGTDIVSLS